MAELTQALWIQSVQQLRGSGIESAEADATAIFVEVLAAPRFLWPLETPRVEAEQIRQMVTDRARRRPLQHVLGRMYFLGLELKAGPGVFCVRPETEYMTDWALRHLPMRRALDLCTGSGAIALAIAAKNKIPVTAVEIDARALDYARANGAALDLEVEWVRGDATAFNPTLGLFDVVISNPPYIPQRDLPAETDWDPRIALWGGGESGMQIPEQIITVAFQYLRGGGYLVMEHDDTQGKACAKVANEIGFEDVEIHRDLAGIERFIAARKPS
ncbi:peptide chain release factor N(5)-glutamine methyltransferase [Gleimia hominis]|uniref:peptide chain release factor N(5)-glutamine methyltransferase n=1 Tax=Gleimia hominis TaxID=595468 RepID=A0ABU3IAJ7_9ACTO|nr:peptide chain release factor N(5)-glutamine methyltransferase [Gleimia hominis]MDT3767397.1 peptide chain release factor N(5)-glutamine methyltransferase [Gleimia hominis]